MYVAENARFAAQIGVPSDILGDHYPVATCGLSSFQRGLLSECADSISNSGAGIAALPMLEILNVNAAVMACG